MFASFAKCVAMESVGREKQTARGTKDVYKRQQLAVSHLLAPGGMILLECAKNTSLSVENSIYFIYKEKCYGDTRIVYVKHKFGEEAAE